MVQSESGAAPLSQAERYELLEQAAGYGAFDWQPQHGTTSLSPAWLEQLGFSHDDFERPGDAWVQLLHPDEAREHLEDLRAFFNSNELLWTRRFRLRTKAGDYRWVLARARAARDADGTLRRLVGVHVDIDAEVRASAALRLLQTIAANSPDLMSFVDRSFRYRYVNEAYAERFGTSRDAIVGLHVRDLVGEEAFEAGIASHLRRCFAGEEVAHQATLRTGGRRWRADARYSPVRDASGVVEGAAVVVRDITALHETQQRLRRTARVFSSTSEGVVLTDADNTIIDVNGAFTAITGYEREEAIGRKPSLLQSGRHDAQFYEGMWAALARRDQWSGEIWNRRKNGEAYAEHLTINAVRGEGGELSGYVALFSDITHRKQATERLQHLAHHDALTGLPNRLALELHLPSALGRARRNGRHLALLFLDLDHFKAVNDTLGHQAGDELLVIIAGRLKALVRESDVVARISGDEFVLVLEDLAEPKHAAPVIRKLLEAVSEPVPVAWQQAQVGGSVGVAIFPEDGASPQRLLNLADAAMYAAKQNGRNRAEFHSAAAGLQAQEQGELVERFAAALRASALELHYQPQLALRSGAILGFEALLRWRDPQLGPVPPDRFLPAAQASGLGPAIDAWVFGEACRQAQAWLGAGLDFGWIAVNIGPGCNGAEGLLPRLRAALERHGVPPERLQVEISERCVTTPGQVDTQLRELQQLGVRVALDDFGTTQTSLARLGTLPLDQLKVDRSLVATLGGQGWAVSAAALALGQALQLEVVAEGVETAEQLNLLTERGYTQAQGFRIARPLDAEHATAVLREGLVGAATWRAEPKACGPSPSRVVDVQAAGAHLDAVGEEVAADG